MALIKVGEYGVATAGTGTGGYTTIHLVPSPGRGMLKNVYFYAYNASNIIFKIFRDDGTNYLFIGQTPSYLTTYSTIATWAAWIPVEKGDFIGWYSDTTNNAFRETGGTYNSVYKSGNVVANSAKDTWSAHGTSIKFGLLGNIYSRVQPFSS